MIELRPFDDFAAVHVFRYLDPSDWREAELVRGTTANHLALFGEWRAMLPAMLASFVVHLDAKHGGAAIALVGLANTGQSGVAQAAFLARHHRKHRVALARCCIEIRNRLPAICADLGIHRVEARCWAAHPTAARFLTGAGFTHEADMPGFGFDGRSTFRQFAVSFPNQQQEQTNVHDQGIQG